MKNPIKINWLILVLGAAMALCLFVYGASLSIGDRVSGDVVGYLSITARFHSFGDAFSFVGDRTYGFPLFLYTAMVVHRFLGAAHWVSWLTWVCSCLFVFHIGACLSFYGGFLREKFQKAGLPSWAPALAAAIIMAFPALVTHTTTPLTDTFCVDLLMVAAALYAASRRSIRGIALGQSALCGLILGYAIMVRPSFWPAVVAFLGACFLQSCFGADKRLRLLSATFILVGILTLIAPALEAGRNVYKTPSLQNPKFVKACSAACIQAGLYSVRVYWWLGWKNDLPGVRDPYLLKTFGNEPGVNSVGTLFKCLLSNPRAMPFYFGKKTIALFDEPYLQPYAVDLTPKWFSPIQRTFEVVAFCGFSAMIFWIISQAVLLRGALLKSGDDLIGFPWIVLVGVLLFTHMLVHIEGRYGFPAIPFSIAALFLGFAAARKAGRAVFLAWLGTMIVAAALFLYQIHSWDLVIPM